MDAIPSRIELASRKNKKDSILLKILGVLCVPCCCAGCICMALSTEVTTYAQLYARLIDFYGGIVLARQMATRVRKQIQIFEEAVRHVNNTSDPKTLSIDPQLTLFDLIRYYNTRFNEVCKSASAGGILEAIQDLQRNSKRAYHSAVYNTFIQMGGNPDDVIYGFIELLLETADPTSTFAIGYVKQILTNTSLKNEMERSAAASAHHSARQT